MSNALPLQIADAVVTELNTHTWTNKPEAFTAARKWIVEYAIEDLATVQVVVLPLTQKDALSTRSTNQTDFTLAIDIQRRPTDFSSVAEVDGYVNFISELKDFYSDRHRLVSPLNDYWIEDSELYSDLLFSPGLLWSGHSFEASIMLTIRGVRGSR